SGLGVPSCAELHLFGLSQSLVVFEVVFLVVGLPFSRTAPRFDDFVLSTLPAMFFHLVAAFNPSCVSVTLSLSFAMFATLGLDSVLLRVCSVDLEDCFWSQVWTHVSRGLASFLPHSCCSLLP
ncbi:hypothetical protein HID58_080051, partial [Brassica napus]